MNLYDFSKNYLKKQTSILFPGFPIDELERYSIPDLYDWSPYFNVKPYYATLDDLMKMFALILQNRASLSNVIKFNRGYFKYIKAVTNNFDVFYLKRKQPDELFDEFARISEITTTISSKSNGPSLIWKNYCIGLIQAANFLSNFVNFQDFILHVVINPIENVLIELETITGISREALGPNFLKEIGFVKFGKKDTHLLPSTRTTGLTSRWKVP